MEVAETPVEKGAWLTSSWSKKNWYRKSSFLPSKVSKLLADVISASVNSLEQEFDDDAEEELDLRRDNWDEREVITCEVWSQVYLLKLKLLAGQERQKSPDSLEGEDPFLSMAREKHKLKIKVLKLKEWKLMHQCNSMGIGLPPAYDTDEENS